MGKKKLQFPQFPRHLQQDAKYILDLAELVISGEFYTIKFVVVGALPALEKHWSKKFQFPGLTLEIEFTNFHCYLQIWEDMQGDKFEAERIIQEASGYRNEPAYVAFFHAIFGGEGELLRSSDWGDSTWRYEVSDLDKDLFPELRRRKYVRIHESNDGFVREI